jgi:hypothetical protein
VAPDTESTPRQTVGKLRECMASVQGGSGYDVGKSAGAAGAKPYSIPWHRLSPINLIIDVWSLLPKVSKSRKIGLPYS